MKNWISFPLSQGLSSKQAHCDLPAGSYERELGKEGFFGPATHMYHAHPPTAWTSFEGDLRPRAFDLRKVNATAASPFDAMPVAVNAAMKFRQWRVEGKMDHLARNADGDELLFVHDGEGDLDCDYGRLSFRDGDYIMLPRAPVWRNEPRGPATIRQVEATNATYRRPANGNQG
ncbi:MAG: homogentisate 1,2-dioxygenase, partial [Tagaea sp.]